MARGLTGIVASEDGIVEKPALALLQELGDIPVKDSLFMGAVVHWSQPWRLRWRALT